MQVTLDAVRLNDRKSAHEYLKEAFGFPDHYGKNLDALYDCLTEMRDMEVHVIHSSEGAGYYPKVLSVFREAGNISVSEE
ncbi:MAG: barstar family protein [Eubacterium sp.]|nr:barstar family protein [Eubacterium sp.]